MTSEVSRPERSGRPVDRPRLLKTSKGRGASGDAPEPDLVGVGRALPWAGFRPRDFRLREAEAWPCSDPCLFGLWLGTLRLRGGAGDPRFLKPRRASNWRRMKRNSASNTLLKSSLANRLPSAGALFGAPGPPAYPRFPSVAATLLSGNDCAHLKYPQDLTETTRLLRCRADTGWVFLSRRGAPQTPTER